MQQSAWKTELVRELNRNVLASGILVDSTRDAARTFRDGGRHFISTGSFQLLG
jgi:hypothetical protein